MEMIDNFKNIDNEKLKNILDIKTKYNKGEITLEEGKKLLKEKVGVIKPYEIALTEQTIKQFDEEECIKENIQEMLILFEDVLDRERPDLEEQHPINMYYLENEKIKNLTEKMKILEDKKFIKNEWLEIYENLTIWTKLHISRKQNQLYSILEKKGFDRPTTTMWVLDDFIKNEVKESYTLLKNNMDNEFLSKQKTIIEDVLDLISKEENILFPTSLSMITNEEFEDMKIGDMEIGYTLDNISQKENIPNSNDNFMSEFKNLLDKYNLNKNNEIPLSNGNLTAEEIKQIFKHMPVDFSFVDDKNTVRFYNDTTHRVFPRSKNVIGRDVANCHPRKSVHLVEEIIEKFRSGEKDKIDFWIDKGDVFIYIYYVAVRDENGKYMGVLEMMQDCTYIRSLKGSRTLLTWDNEEKTEFNKTDEVITDISKITKDTYLKDLLNICPELKDYLPKINSKFALIKTPLARVMLPTATIEKMAERSGMNVDDLINNINEFISKQ